MKQIAAAVLASLLLATPATAETLAGDVIAIYERDAGARQEIEAILLHTQNGFGWANSALKVRGTQPLYCSPGQIVFTGRQLFDVLKRSVATEAKIASAPIGYALLLAMQRTYHCGHS